MQCLIFSPPARIWIFYDPVTSRNLEIPEVRKFESMLKWAKHRVAHKSPKVDARLEFKCIMERLARDLKLYRISPQELIKVCNLPLFLNTFTHDQVRSHLVQHEYVGTQLTYILLVHKITSSFEVKLLSRYTSPWASPENSEGREVTCLWLEEGGGTKNKLKSITK